MVNKLSKKIKKEYLFMWGQKQSAMITELMYSVLSKKGKLMNENFPEELSVYANGVYENYMPRESVLKWEKNGEKYYSNKKLVKKLFADIKKFIADYFSYFKKINKADFKNYDNRELAEFFTEYEKYILDAMIYFGTSTPSALKSVEKKIKKILFQKIKDEDLLKKYLIILSTPSQPDETMKERMAMMKMAKGGKISQRDIIKFTHSFPALFFNTYDEGEVYDFVLKQIGLKNSGKNSGREIQAIKKHLAESRREHSQIYKDFPEVKYWAEILQGAALYRYKLKHVWSGAEYLFLGFLKETAKRIGVNFNDFIRAYLFVDISNFLKRGKKLTQEDVNKRKKCITLHYFNRKDHIYFGQAGLDYKDKLIGHPKESKIKKSDIIKGDIASRGKVTGKARLVFVEDLKKFVADGQSFKKGEILVTTMTSPIMVPIIAKAGGIITDEGGITSHAAVTAREFKIPCIVGTHGASFVIKTGDLVEVDANKGIVKILKK